MERAQKSCVPCDSSSPRALPDRTSALSEFMAHPNYASNVFINCPFDEHYRPLRDALIFTIQDCGFIPRCALEVDNSGEVRIDTILRLIRESKYGIHDISRIEIDRINGLPRFNMPFELGLFLGARKFGVREQKSKSALILD